MSARQTFKSATNTLLFVVLAISALVLSARHADATPIYWNVFNIEDESAQSAVTVTYGSLTDMLDDTNRTGSFLPGGFNVGQNVVGSGSDGSSYWNVFNIEDESQQSAVTVTYGSLTDMLNDTNRTGSFLPGGFNVGQNVVGSGAFVISAPAVEIPEPATLSLFGFGLACLGAASRWRKKA